MSTPKKLRRRLGRPVESRRNPISEQSIALTLEAFAAMGERIVYLCGPGLSPLMIGVFRVDAEDIQRVCDDLIVSGHSVIRAEIREGMTTADLATLDEISSVDGPFVVVAALEGYGALLFTNDNNCTFGHEVPRLLEGVLGVAS